MASANEGMRRFLKKTYTASYSSLASGGRLAITATDIGYSIPAGYMPVGLPYFTTGATGVMFDRLLLDGTSSMVHIYNTHSSARSGSVIFTVLFAPIAEAETPPDWLNPT